MCSQENIAPQQSVLVRTWLTLSLAMGLFLFYLKVPHTVCESSVVECTLHPVGWQAEAYICLFNMITFSVTKKKGWWQLPHCVCFLAQATQNNNSGHVECTCLCFPSVYELLRSFLPPTLRGRILQTESTDGCHMFVTLEFQVLWHIPEIGRCIARPRATNINGTSYISYTLLELRSHLFPH